MKINAVKRFILEDYPKETRSWLGKLLQSLNQFLEQAIQILQNGITVADNMKSLKKELTIQVNQSYPIKLAYTLNERPSFVLIGSLREDTGSPAAPTTAVYPYWELKEGSLELTMVGLDAAKKYKLTIIAII
ncbi:MAG TPA: hypothetical protein V6C65_26305 [Allocoleopsis sp.]